MKKSTKRMLSLFVSLCVALAMVAPAAVFADAQAAALADQNTAEAPKDEIPVAEDITVFYTNDVHTYIDKGSKAFDYAKLATLKKGYNPTNVLVLDAGDHIQGTAYGSMDNGKTIVKLMDAVGYDAATLGNHEFDYGMLRALNVAQNSKTPYLSCNFYNEKNGKRGSNVLDSYKIFEKNGKKIAVIGITTPESFTKSTPAYFQNEKGEYIYGIAGGTDGSELYADVQKAIDAAKKENPDYVIALGHLGDDPSSSPWTSEETIANVSGLDAFIDGHSHSTVPSKEVKGKDGKTVILTQTGSYFDAIGKITIAKNGKITSELLTDGSKIEQDETVKAIQDKWITEVDTKLGEVIGDTTISFDNYLNDDRLVRKQETNTGDFAADALYYLFEDLDYDVDVAVMNGGGVRNKTITGNLSYKSCKDIHTFGNVACLIKVTGKQLLDALEWGAKDYPNECGGFLQVSGITYRIDPTVESTVQKDDKGVWTGSPTGAYRVYDVKVLNKKTKKYETLKLDKSYNLAGYNYTLRDLGDGFAMFTGAENIIDYVSQDYMVLANYIKSFPKNKNTKLPTITAKNSPYADINGEGRILIVPNGQQVNDMAKAIKVTATSKKQSKSIKVTAKVSKGRDAVADIRDMGYKVSYKYYQSTKKSSGYTLKKTTANSTYKATGLKKGKTYYYKVRVVVTDSNNNLIAQSPYSKVTYKKFK